MSAGGPTSCAANSGNCGTVTVSSPSGAGEYYGTVTAAPAAGGAASSTFNLFVLGQPVLSLTGCSTVTAQAPPAQSTFSCTVGNSGPSAASGISYATNASGVGISGGPTSCAAGNPNCGTVTVTTPAVAGTYAGNLTASPALGSAATASFSLHENSLATLAFTNCSTVSPATTPTHASMTCTLVNNGETASGVLNSGVSVSMASLSLSGSNQTCAGNSTCGVWSISTTNGGTYSGTLSVSPANGVGTGTSFAFNLTENAPVVQVFSLVSSSGQTTTFQNSNGFAVPVVSSGITVIGGGNPYVTTNTCTGSIAAGATCTIVFVAPPAQCASQHYKVNAYVQDSAGQQVGEVVSKTGTGICQ